MVEEMVPGDPGYDGAPPIKWFVPQCLVDQHAGNTVSYACHLAILNYSHLVHQALSFNLYENETVSSAVHIFYKKVNSGLSDDVRGHGFISEARGSSIRVRGCDPLCSGTQK